jgi:hypothetical protein
MAQLSGVMTADFSDFHFEIDKSVVKLKDLESASGHTDSAMGEFSEGLGVADKTLAALGVHIGPQIRAIQELGNVSGITFEKLGLWGSLGLAASVGTATYAITTMALEFTGLDKAIAGVVDTWSGFTAERAAAGMDVLTRATQIAGREIKDFDTAMQIIKKHNQEVAESFNTGAQRVADWNREITAHKADMPQITAELKNHSSTVQQLAQHYGISREAIEYYTQRATENAKILKGWHEAEEAHIKKVNAAQLELNQAGGGWRDTLKTIEPAAAATATAYIAMGQSLTTIATAGNLSTIQINALDRAYKEQLTTLAALEPKTQSLDTWMRTVGQQFAVAAENGDQFKTMLELTGGTVDAIVPKIEKLDTVFRSVTEAAKVAPGMTQMSPGNAPVPINTGNITYGLGGFEAVFAEYQRKNPSGGMLGGQIGGGPPKDFLTWALSMGLAQRTPTITNTFNMVDTQDGLARKVGETISSQIQRGSLVN